jgi:hypothetical protein
MQPVTSLGPVFCGVGTLVTEPKRAAYGTVFAFDMK